MKSIRFTELFFSLQGESVLTGLPTVFVRLTGCPLRCQYCDTAYAFHGGQWMEQAEVLEKVRAFDVPRVSRIVDIKTPGSREVERNLWSNIAQLRATDEVKFVLCDRTDYDWARSVV